MPLPALAIGAGKLVGGALLGKLFGGGGRNRSRYSPRQFSYTPDENDPELGLLRRRALEEISRGRGRAVDEIGRAGLLGSSAAFGVLGEQERRGFRELEDIDASTFARRRLEALELFRDEENFGRQLELGEQGQGFRERMLGLDSLGNIGGFLGGSLEEYLRNRNQGDEEFDLFESSRGRYL